MQKKVKPILEEHIGALLETVNFTENDILKISKYLKNYVANEKIPVVIEALRHCCELGLFLWQTYQDDPTATQIRAALDNIHHHASALADAINRADIRTDSILRDIAHFDMGNIERRGTLVLLLETLADGVKRERETVTNAWGRPRAPVMQIKIIHDVFLHHSVQLEPSRGKDFSDISNLCFEKMRIPSGSENAIKEYLKTLKNPEA